MGSGRSISGNLNTLQLASLAQVEVAAPGAVSRGDGKSRERQGIASASACTPRAPPFATTTQPRPGHEGIEIAAQLLGT